MKKVTVIGSGFSGLSCAAYLAKNGCDVTVIEKNDNCGCLLYTSDAADES